ncbi:MAG: DNA cytosine methyltransferase [Clostridiales bacterium]|nr:DNA cytosine methyltransferase [Clostridiales bacterium]
MKVGSLFSGIGGLDLGLERAGMDIRWQVEIDKACNRVLERHWPDVRRYRDVREVHGDELEPVELICGGFPCQDLSVAGRRAGLVGERSGLFYEFARILDEIRPRWVLIENVPGLLSSRRGWDMGAVVGTLAELGYGWAYRILDAQYFGVPQRRRRVYIVGYLGDPRRAAEVLFEPESGPWHPTPSRKAGETVATLLASGAGTNRPAGIASETDSLITQALTRTYANGGADDNKAQGGFVVPVVSYTLHSNPGGVGQGHNVTFVPVAHTLTSRYDSSEDGTGRRTPIVPTVTNKWAKGTGGPSGDETQNLVFTGGVRRLTPREAERLQGFPDDWTRWGADGRELSDSARYRLIGNAVCVPVAE